jgi:tetratricopeptide (TPR) repeat protein
MTWCEAERGNLAAVTRWAAANGFCRYGWQIPATVQDVFERYGRQDDVLELQELALASARLDDHEIGQIVTHINLGVTHFVLRDDQRAAASFEAGLRMARGAGYLAAEVACSHNLASLYLRAGDTARAVQMYEEILNISRKDGNPAGEAAALQRLGDASRRMGRYDHAVRYLRGALASWERIGSWRGQGTTHGEFAALYLDHGQLELAYHHGHLAVEIHGRTRDETGRCDVLITMADIQRRLFRYPDAIRDGELAVALSEEIADPRRRCRALAVLAKTLAEDGSKDAAVRMCAEALVIVNNVSDPEAGTIRAELVAIQKALD